MRNFVEICFSFQTVSIILFIYFSFSIDKPKALSLLLHTADISHPAKSWDLHHRWTTSLLEEFFRQVSGCSWQGAEKGMLGCSAVSFSVQWFVMVKYKCSVERTKVQSCSTHPVFSIPFMLSVIPYFLFSLYLYLGHNLL